MKLIDSEVIGGLIDPARAAARRRANLNWHAEYDKRVQRLFIAIAPGSYVRPHHHMEANEREFFMVLRGAPSLRPSGAVSFSR